MMTYANQKIITVNKEATDNSNLYMCINKNTLFMAIKEMTHLELKVYVYLASNQQGYQFALSTTDICNCLGGNKRKIQEAISSLIKKGYIVSDKENKYNFFERPMCTKRT